MKKTLSALAAAVICFAAAAQNEEKPTVYMVANAHWDTQWNWDIQRSINEFLPNTLKQNFRLFEQYPDYVFSLEGAVKYDMAKEYMPELYEQLKKYVQQGRWHVAGTGWDANDPNMPSVESCIRNYLYGQTFYKNEFGVKSNDVMLPDCFGFSYLIPTIADHCGIIGFGTQKLNWRYSPFYENGRKVPFNFGIWEGIDGSRIMALMDGGGYSWVPKEDMRNDKEINERLREASIPAAYRYFGTKSSRLHGDQGGSPTPLAVDLIHYGAEHPLGYNIKFASSSQMYEDYYMDSRLPVFKGELLMDVHATGCYTSHTEIKKLNRRIEWLLGSAEALGVLAEQLGVMEYPSYTFDQIWKRTLVHQFHDDLTGTSIPRAYQFTYNDHYLSVNQLENLIDAQLQAIGRVLDTKLSGTPLLVYNPVTASGSSIVLADVDLPAKYSSVAVYDHNGKKMKSQLVSREEGKATIAFCANVPSASVAVFELRPSGAKDAAGSIKVGKDYIENAVYKVQLNSNGDICSIVDKRYGKQLVKEGEAFALNIFSDNNSDSWPAWEILKDVMDKEPSLVGQDVKISCDYAGPVKAALKVERKAGESTFVQRIVLHSGACEDRIDIENDIDWHTRESLLKASFPVAFNCPEARYDLGLGNILRGNNTKTQYEVYAHQWADMSADDGSYGVTIMNDSKYGWDKPDNNTLRLTLLHTPATKKNYTHQRTMDLGKHSFTYSIIGHKGDVDPVAADIASDLLNQPMLSASVAKTAGKSRVVTLIESSNPSIRIKAVKKAIDGNGYIVRTYQQSGTDASADITMLAPIVSAQVTNGVEEDVKAAQASGRKLHVDAKGFGLNTYRVCTTPVSCPGAAKYEKVDVPYDHVAISSDAFSAFGHLGKDWKSFAAEILPEELNVFGVPYSFGKADFNNAAMCQGQSVALPEGTKTVHLLAVSTTQDKSVTFNAGADVQAKVGYFGGWYGSYAWEGYYDSFVRDCGRVAYVGTHTHDAYKRNEAYVNSYMFAVDVPVAGGSQQLVLPQDKDIVVLAITAEK